MYQERQPIHLSPLLAKYKNVRNICQQITALDKLQLQEQGRPISRLLDSKTTFLRNMSQVFIRNALNGFDSQEKPLDINNPIHKINLATRLIRQVTGSPCYARFANVFLQILGISRQENCTTQQLTLLLIGSLNLWKGILELIRLLHSHKILSRLQDKLSADPGRPIHHIQNRVRWIERLIHTVDKYIQNWSTGQFSVELTVEEFERALIQYYLVLSRICGQLPGESSPMIGSSLIPLAKIIVYLRSSIKQSEDRMELYEQYLFKQQGDELNIFQRLMNIIKKIEHIDVDKSGNLIRIVMGQWYRSGVDRSRFANQFITLANSTQYSCICLFLLQDTKLLLNLHQECSLNEIRNKISYGCSKSIVLQAIEANIKASNFRNRLTVLLRKYFSGSRSLHTRDSENAVQFLIQHHQQMSALQLVYFLTRACHFLQEHIHNHLVPGTENLLSGEFLIMSVKLCEPSAVAKSLRWYGLKILLEIEGSIQNLRNKYVKIVKADWVKVAEKEASDNDKEDRIIEQRLKKSFNAGQEQSNQDLENFLCYQMLMLKSYIKSEQNLDVNTNSDNERVLSSLGKIVIFCNLLQSVTSFTMSQHKSKTISVLRYIGQFRQNESVYFKKAFNECLSALQCLKEAGVLSAQQLEHIKNLNGFLLRQDNKFICKVYSLFVKQYNKRIQQWLEPYWIASGYVSKSSTKNNWLLLSEQNFLTYEHSVAPCLMDQQLLFPSVFVQEITDIFASVEALSENQVIDAKEILNKVLGSLPPPKSSKSLENIQEESHIGDTWMLLTRVWVFGLSCQHQDKGSKVLDICMQYGITIPKNLQWLSPRSVKCVPVTLLLMSVLYHTYFTKQAAPQNCRESLNKDEESVIRRFVFSLKDTLKKVNKHNIAALIKSELPEFNLSCLYLRLLLAVVVSRYNHISNNPKSQEKNQNPSIAEMISGSKTIECIIDAIPRQILQITISKILSVYGAVSKFEEEYNSLTKLESPIAVSMPTLKMSQSSVNFKGLNSSVSFGTLPITTPRKRKPIKIDI